MAAADELRTIRICLVVFVFGLFVSGVTAFPLQSELAYGVRLLHRPSLLHVATVTHLLPWVDRVYRALADTNARYPILSYGTDWLAFAHLLFAVLFVGPMIDPVRNKWVTVFGVVACAAIPFLAFIAGPVRGIPVGWRLVDSSFGVFGVLPLLVALRSTNRLEREGAANIDTMLTLR